VTLQFAAARNLTFEQFPFQTYDKVRYADTDRQGHVNNAAFATFLETGRVEFLYDPQSPLTADNGSFVIAGLNLRFVSEVNWPGRIDIGTGVIRVGKSSLSLYQGLFQDGRCVASAETVIVQINDNKKSCPLTEETRVFLGRHMLPA
jgi:acyl-CoA thioester hydrolase